jgi:two-component system phosphate regulon response regulator OmpR
MEANPAPAANGAPQSCTGKIVIVDDDIRIRELLDRYLTQAGFTVLVAEDAAGLAHILAYEIVDVIVLDLMLPGEDGLSICARLRKSRNKTPIIMLTARDEEADRIYGLELGADDYLGKPFNPRELLARLQAVLRRRPPRELPGAPGADRDEQVHFGPFTLDMAARTLSRDGQALPLSTSEFAMLKALVRNPRQPLAREKLARLTSRKQIAQYGRSLDVQISRLRKLIETDPARPSYLQTVWGMGYVFVPDGTIYPASA